MSDPLLSEVSAGDDLPELVHAVTPTTVVLGAVASRDWRPMHHDYKFATERNGVADIFLNTPNQAAWFERYITDWTGPRGRIRSMTFRMRDSVFPGEDMTFRAKVTDTGTDDVWEFSTTMLYAGDCVGGTASESFEWKFNFNCSVYEPMAGNRTHTLDLTNGAQDIIDVWWNDEDPTQFTTHDIDVLFFVDMNSTAIVTAASMTMSR